ncbi:repressor - phage associated [Streptococcus dysgalactiae subsp. equisimilis]|nr:repressor - phage associated [Streptococcus dysgalactiae subsp. equisimilis]
MFPTFDIVKELCNKQGISINALEEKVGFSRNSLYSWKSSEPKPSKLKVVADYFGVSTDYLLGRTDNPKMQKTVKSINLKIYEKWLKMQKHLMVSRLPNQILKLSKT